MPPVLMSRGAVDAETLDLRIPPGGLRGDGIQPPPATAPERATIGYLRAWMLVLPVDLVLMLAPVPFNADHWRGLTVMGLLTIALLASGGLYRSRLHLSILDEAPVILSRFLVAAALVAFIAALRHESFANFGSLLRAAAVMVVLLLVGRGLAMWTIMMGRRRRIVGHATILVGSGPVAADLAEVLARYPQYGLRVVGYVDNPHRADHAVHDLTHLGDLDDLTATMARAKADVLLIADPNITDSRFAGLLRQAMVTTYDILVVPRMHQFQTQTARPDHIGAIPVMRIRPPRLSGWRWGLKRSVDVVFSALALLALAPVLALCALAVRIEGGPGVLFRQQRVGRHGKLFEVLKFRSMRPASEAESQTTWSVANDSRVGPVGRFLRRTSLDELPQLWNILRGDMTLVGPRPERPHFVEVFSAAHSHYSWRHRVPAGLTGLAQVSGLRGDTPISDRARFDNYYIENWSLWLDFKILLRTIREVLVAGGR
ncbi:exopolysaccharide biosynthesis polyprenyl glycosylphosphotransferase [Micromonospora sp. A200]|uniref:sugar transferase n=1 Tax=Micromonospora sp. A200 TaxID=2940568 RepID=UPI00247489F0|nr:sugar transferase [Micromonospora sp. A200]MDH6463129.1 exopolysaccharide biosynthesis polyprenyl glycosylphosphotransferase [Micromonospora sp. A200]